MLRHVEAVLIGLVDVCAAHGQLGHAEIGDAEMAVAVHEQVRRLQISMGDSGSVKILKIGEGLTKK